MFEPVFAGADFAVYGFEKDVVVPTGTPTLATLVNVADSLYYGVRNITSQDKTDAECLSDVASKGICPNYSDLSKKATYNDAAVVLANALPESYYRELCFNVDINGGDEALKLVRAGIFDESTDFTAEISYAELSSAVEKLTDSTKRSVENKRTFYVLGDSLTEAYGPSSSTKGWPEFIENYFTGNIALTNYGIAGINTGTYFNSAHVRAPGYYNKMITSVRKGDYVVIALGTNDSTLWGQGNMTKDQSRANYCRLISEIRAQGGIPVLVGPVGRNETDEDGNYKESDPDIIPVMQSVNETYGVNVPIINFKDVSFDTLSAMTAAERSEFYIDSVHYRAKGANMVASWFEELVLCSDEAQLYGLKNHCVNFKEEIPAEYFTINIGERQSETNIRYAEINGKRTEITENAENVYAVMLSANTLIGIIEKTEKNAADAVKTQYFHLDVSTKTATKLSLDYYMETYDEKSIRTREPMGIRFKSHVLTAAKLEENEFVIDEIGFIVAVTDVLGDDELTLDFSKYVSGVAYNKADGTDIVFDRSDDTVDVFTCVVRNIPVSEHKTNLTCKTYTKITVGGEQFTLYGEKVVGNVYDTAQTLLTDDTLDTETKNALYQIILDYESAIGLPGDDLYE